MAAARSNSLTEIEYEKDPFVMLDPHANHMENQFNPNQRHFKT